MFYLTDDLIARAPNWRFADFKQHALALAAYFKQQQTKAVAVWLQDGATLACVLLAAWQTQTTVLFPPNATPESQQWADQYADFWITDLDFDHPQAVKFSEILQKAEHLQNLQEIRPLFDPTNPSEVWLKTSGSSGEAKTIVKTAAELWKAAEILGNALPWAKNAPITTVSTVSIQHIYGLTVQIMMSLVQGWTIGRTQQFFPENVQAECQKAEQAVVISSPAMLSRIDWHNFSLPHCVGVISSGGALAEDLSEQIRLSLNQPVVEIYGSTETGPIAVRADIGLWRTLPESQVGIDEQGALWLEASWAKDRQQTADAVNLFENGFELLGRVDRIVKIGDKRTSLVSVENRLNSHPWVADCYIAKHPDTPRLASWTALNENGIYAYQTQGRKAVIDTLKAFLAESVEPTALPRSWRFTDQLPRNAQSKISRLDFEAECRLTEAGWDQRVRRNG